MTSKIYRKLYFVPLFAFDYLDDENKTYELFYIVS
jgi:hypothetical protein